MFLQDLSGSSVAHCLKGTHMWKQKDQLGAIEIIPMRDDFDS